MQDKAKQQQNVILMQLLEQKQPLYPCAYFLQCANPDSPLLSAHFDLFWFAPIKGKVTIVSCSSWKRPSNPSSLLIYLFFLPASIVAFAEMKRERRCQRRLWWKQISRDLLWLTKG